MDIKDLSICIVGKDKGTYLKQCIESCFKLTHQISYIDSGSKDDSVAVAETFGIYVVNASPDQKISGKLKKYHETKWILFLKPDERASYKSKSRIMKTLDKNQTMGYSLVIKTPVLPEALEDFRWIKIPGKPNRYPAESLIVPKIEIRLVRRQFFVKSLNLMISFSKERVFSFTSQIFKDIQIHSLEDIEKTPEKIDQNCIKNLEMKYLKGEISIDAQEDYGMWELGEHFISYNVLRKEDFARYYRGLSMGFGSEKMYLTMLNSHMKYGRFSEARDFFDAWHTKWGIFDIPEPYKVGGIIYLHLFQFEKAISLFNKYLELSPEKDTGDAYSLLAKSFLLLGKKNEALCHFKQSVNHNNDNLDNDIIHMIEDNNWKPSKLSLCMIARDEQANICKALDSVEGIVDEIIVIDTGSQDETKDIARKYNAKIIDVYWEDDFSKARNAGFKHVTGDYILYLDADEYIDPRDKLKLALLKIILPSGRDLAFRIKIDTEDEDEEMTVMMRLPKIIQPKYSVRLVPACKEIIFDGSAFESMDKSIVHLGMTIVTNDVFKITHSGIDRKWRELRKEQAVQKIYSTGATPKTAMNAALYNLRIGNIHATSQWLELAHIDNPRLWMKIITLYCRMGQTKNVVGIIRKALCECPDSIELCLAKAELHFAQGEYEAVHETLNPHMDHIEKEMTREDRATAAYLYGMALLETGDLLKSIEYLSDARDLDSWNMRYKIGGIYALTIAEEWESVIHAVSAVMKEENLYIIDTINDFADLGIVFKKLSLHFGINNRIEASEFCQNIFLNITGNKISNPEIIEKMIDSLDTHNIGKE